MKGYSMMMCVLSLKPNLIYKTVLIYLQIKVSNSRLLHVVGSISESLYSINDVNCT